MKQFISLILIVGFSLVSFGQQQKRSMMNDFTTDQHAILKTKQLTLDLNLTSAQQQKVLSLNKKSAIDIKKAKDQRLKLKESGNKLSSQQVFDMKNTRLDKQIAYQNEMKKILTETQFDAWKENKRKRDQRGKSDKRSKGKKPNSRRG